MALGELAGRRVSSLLAHLLGRKQPFTSLATGVGQKTKASVFGTLPKDSLRLVSRSNAKGVSPAAHFQGVSELSDPKYVVVGNEHVLLTSPQGRKLSVNAVVHHLRPGDPLPTPAVTVPMPPDPLGPKPKTGRYLYTIDEQGLHVALEDTRFPTRRGTIVHSNLSRRAYTAGEAWFINDKTVIINGVSGRFGPRNDRAWHQTIAFWKALGYQVYAEPLPLTFKIFGRLPIKRLLKPLNAVAAPKAQLGVS